MERKIIYRNVAVALLVVGLLFPINANAYVFTGWKFSNPGSVKYKVSVSAGQYHDIISKYTKTWESKCKEIGVKNVESGDNIYFYCDLDIDNGSYGVTYNVKKDHNTITFYKAFRDATSAHKNETIVHEVGHALGLDHCQKEKNAHSVMRATGFNGKAYPLSDDISGISALY